MNIIIVTHNKYLELGLKKLLSSILLLLVLIFLYQIIVSI